MSGLCESLGARPGAVDVMPPRHFVSFQPNQVVVKDANEVNYTTDSRALRSYSQTKCG